jgi:hypothetical protein
MKKYFFLLAFTFFIFSCSEKQVTIPDDVIKEKEMTAILTDVHIAQAALSNKSQTDSSSYKITDYVNEILKDHNISQEDFTRSLKFYSENPEILQQVYDSVITGLSRIEAGVER